MRVFSTRNLVPRLLAVFFAGQWVALQLLVRAYGGLQFLEYFWIGNDFSYFYSAAGFYLSGKSPYLEANFVPLPAALYVPLVLHRLSYWDAFTAYRLVNLMLMVAALAWLCRQLTVSLRNAALVLLILISYGPFYTLLSGGNLDGLMLVFLVFSCARREPVRGAFLGLSIGTKFYSLLLVPLLMLQRRWKELFWAFLALAVLLLPFVRYMPDALGSVTHRTAVLRMEDNQSPAVLFIRIFGEHRAWLWKGCYVLLWGGTLVLRLMADYKPTGREGEQRFLSLNYLPWMAAAPLLVFPYTSAILLPFIVRLTKENQDRALHWADWITVGGLGLTGVYATLFSRILRLSFGHVSDSTIRGATLVMPSLAITVLLVGVGAGALIDLRRRQQSSSAEVPARPEF